MSAVFSRRLEVLLISVGVLLLAFAGGALLVGRIQKQRALVQFKKALEAPVPTALPPATPVPQGALALPSAADTSRWAPERIKAFEESLLLPAGAPLAVLRIPKIGLEVPVFYGTDEPTLNRGVGLIEDTARPDEAGNVGIAGHRDGFFRALMDVQQGDAIELETPRGKRAYEVASIRIVSPNDVSVLDATPDPELTLVTCYPFYFVGSAPERYIVRAVASPPR